jgi:hypothetical protein
MHAIQRRASTNSRLVDRRRLVRPPNPKQMLLGRPAPAFNSLRTIAGTLVAPAPLAASSVFSRPHERPTPIGQANDAAASFNPASNTSRIIPRGRLLCRGTYLNPQAFRFDAGHRSDLMPATIPK